MLVGNLRHSISLCNTHLSFTTVLGYITTVLGYTIYLFYNTNPFSKMVANCFNTSINKHESILLGFLQFANVQSAQFHLVQYILSKMYLLITSFCINSVFIAFCNGFQLFR